eukprot:gene43649-66910_t
MGHIYDMARHFQTGAASPGKFDAWLEKVDGWDTLCDEGVAQWVKNQELKLGGGAMRHLVVDDVVATDAARPAVPHVPQVTVAGLLSQQRIEEERLQRARDEDRERQQRRFAERVWEKRRGKSAADPSAAAADGSDVTTISVHIVDGDGMPVPHGMELERGTMQLLNCAENSATEADTAVGDHDTLDSDPPPAAAAAACAVPPEPEPRVAAAPPHHTTHPPPHALLSPPRPTAADGGAGTAPRAQR